MHLIPPYPSQINRPNKSKLQPSPTKTYFSSVHAPHASGYITWTTSIAAHNPRTFQFNHHLATTPNFQKREMTWIWTRDSFTLHQIKAANSNVSPRRGPNFHITKQVTKTPNPQLNFCVGINSNTRLEVQRLLGPVITKGSTQWPAGKIPSNSLTEAFVVVIIMCTSPTWGRRCFGDILQNPPSWIQFPRLLTNLPTNSLAWIQVCQSL